jgi:hypothetical protein
MNDFVIISDKPISQEVVEGIGMPEPTNEQKSIKLKFLEEIYGAEKKANKASGVPAKNNEGTEIANNDSKENSAIKLYTPEKIEEIKKHIDPKQTIDTKVNIGYYYRKHFDLNPVIKFNNPINALFGKVSIANGQGFKACNCVTGTCGKGTRCTFFKSGLQCNSRCHKGGNNPNCTMKKDITEKMKKK